MVAFATGSITVQSAKTKAELRAIMKGDENGEIVLGSISETQVKTDPRAQEVAYVLGDEEIVFQKSDVKFYSISVAKDPPLIDTSLAGIISPSARR